MATTQMFVPGFGDDGQLVVVDGEDLAKSADLFKSIAAQALSPRATRSRISETMHLLGAYTGIKDPEQAHWKSMYFLDQVGRAPLVQAIVNTRANQLSEAAHIRQAPDDTSFEITLRNKRAPMTRAARKQKELIEQIMINGGQLYDSRGRLRTHPETGEPGVWSGDGGSGREHALGLRATVAAMVRALMVFDFAPLRKEPGEDWPKDDKYPVAWFNPIDPKVVRVTVPDRYTPQIDDSGLPIKWVEMQPGMPTSAALPVVREYTWQTMGVLIQNPRLGLLGDGYGWSVVEQGLELVASSVLNLKFRREYFDSNHTPPAIVKIKGPLAGFTAQSIETLRTQIALKGGGTNAFWKLLYLPLQADPNSDVEVMPLREATGAINELEFSLSDQMALINFFCAIAGMDPSELGFQSYDQRSSSIGNENPTQKLAHSVSKGLVPLAAAFKAFLDLQIVQLIDPDFEWTWYNLDPNERLMDDQRAQARLALGDTPNQIKDLQDETRAKNANDTNLWQDVSEQFDLESFDTDDDWRAAIDDEYVKQFKALYGEDGDAEPWSVAWDLPVGNQLMMQIRQTELEQLQRGKQKRKQLQAYIAQGYPPEQAQMMVDQGQQGMMPPNGQDPNAPGAGQDAGQGGGPGSGPGGGPAGPMAALQQQQAQQQQAPQQQRQQPGPGAPPSGAQPDDEDEEDEDDEQAPGDSNPNPRARRLRKSVDAQRAELVFRIIRT